MGTTITKTRTCSIEDLTTPSMAGTVYVSCLQPKTTKELVQFIYGVDSAASVNSTPVIRARAALHQAHYLVTEGDMLRNTGFRATTQPIREYARTVIARDSDLEFDDTVFDALEKVLDSQWFRGFFSHEFLRNPPRYVVYNNIHIDGKGKLTVSDAMRLVTGITADIGVFGIALHKLRVSEGGFPLLEINDILNVSQFDECIRQNEQKIPVSLLERFTDEFCRYRTGGPEIPAENRKTIVPEKILEQMSWIPGILPVDLCALMARSSDRPPLTLLSTLMSTVIPNIVSGKKHPKKL